jgi:hypothetical protein
MDDAVHASDLNVRVIGSERPTGPVIMLLLFLYSY